MSTDVSETSVQEIEEKILQKPIDLIGVVKTGLVLASANENAVSLLKKIGVEFHTIPPEELEEEDFERHESCVPQEHVQSIALQRAKLVADRHPDALVVALETVVFFKGEILSEPKKPSAAFDMLKKLSGQTHSVFTGMALLHSSSNRTITCVEETKVTFAELKSHEVTAYVASGIALNRPGAYDITDAFGCLLVAGIVGDYYNVAGMPLRRLYRSLKRDFSDLIESEFESPSKKTNKT